MNNLIVQDIKSRLPMPQGLNDLDPGKWRVLCESVFPTAKTPEAVVLAIDYCKARKLDIFKKPVNIVPMWSSALGREVETVWPGINEAQVTASRTGKYAGLEKPVWGPMLKTTFKGVKKNETKETIIELSYPEFCEVTVYKMVDGVKCAFTEQVFWEEAYARIGKTDLPNEMWKKRPRGQLHKCAKAASLRAAFPEEAGYTAEEMEGKVIEELEGITIEHAPVTPFDVDKIKPKSPFKTATLRREHQLNAIAALDKAESVAQLNETYKLYKPRIEEMKVSGDERDQLSAEEIHKGYQRMFSKLNQVRSPEPEEEPTFDPEEIPDDVPPFLKDEFRMPDIR